VRALPVDREALAVPEATVGAEVHEALDVHLHLAAQVALDLVLGVDDLADRLDLLLGQLVDLLVEGDLGPSADLLRGGASDTVEVRERVDDVLATRKIDARDTCHVVLLKLPAAACAGGSRR